MLAQYVTLGARQIDAQTKQSSSFLNYARSCLSLAQRMALTFLGSKQKQIEAKVTKQKELAFVVLPSEQQILTQRTVRS